MTAARNRRIPETIWQLLMQNQRSFVSRVGCGTVIPNQTGKEVAATNVWSWQPEDTSSAENGIQIFFKTRSMQLHRFHIRSDHTRIFSACGRFFCFLACSILLLPKTILLCPDPSHQQTTWSVPGSRHLNSGIVSGYHHFPLSMEDKSL